jgi:hypothetical protein
MNIQTSLSTAAAPGRPAGVRNSKIPAGATVTHDAEKDCFSYSAPGHHYSVCRHNPLIEGGKAAALVGVPALAGALANEAFGTVTAGLAGTWGGVVGGVLLGATIGGYRSYKGSNNSPFHGVLGGLGGALAGGVALPLLLQPGLWGGMAGAAAATGVAGIGVGAFMAHRNHRNTQDAKAHGWKP